MKRASCVLVILLSLAVQAWAEDVDKPPPRPATPPRVRERPAPAVPPVPHILSQVYLGEPAPDFELDGSEGRPVRLEHLKGYWVLLVFADRRQSLGDLREIHPSLRQLGVRTYGICSDKAYVLKSYAERERLPIVLLSDVTGEISELYGLYDHTLSAIRPGFVLMDRQGVVQVALLGQSLPPADMLEMLKTVLAGS